MTTYTEHVINSHTDIAFRQYAFENFITYQNLDYGLELLGDSIEDAKALEDIKQNAKLIISDLGEPENENQDLEELNEPEEDDEP